ncbi:MAG: MBL fold metallo-hydrolase [Candidatus Bipolaricaulota bacterium]
MKLLSYSKALYSNWLYYSPDNMLFDAGEGVSSIMGNKSFAVERVLLSHGHADHIAGLIGLVNIRNNAMGDKAKPLTVYYPKDNFHISELMNYLHRTNSNLSYQLEWKPLEPGDVVQVFGEPQSRNARHVEAFQTEHSQREVSLGYNVVETRQKLKEEYNSLAQQEIEKLAREEERNEIMENYQQKIFTYGGDSVGLDPQKIQKTEMLFHDATFLEEEDRKQYKHATLEEAVQVAKEAQVKKELFAFHISSRYRGRIDDYAEEINRRPDVNFSVTLLEPGQIFSRG